jgi:hypothetical protein
MNKYKINLEIRLFVLFLNANVIYRTSWNNILFEKPKEEIFRPLWNPKVHCRFRTYPPVQPFPILFNSVHILVP